MNEMIKTKTRDSCSRCCKSIENVYQYHKQRENLMEI
jgi:hypothetical protein